MAKGHVERVGPTRFRAVVYAGKDPITGKKLYLKESYDTEHEAEAARVRLVAQVEADTTPDRSATVRTLMNRWMEVVDHELSTAETTAGYVRRTIVPALGDLPLRKIQHRVDILDRLYTHLRRCNVLCDGRNGGPGHVCRPMTPSTIRRIHAILSAAFNYAVSWGWMERNPAEYAHPPKLTRRRAQPPEPAAVARLLNVAMASDLELGVFLWLAVTTGARRGELSGLRWSRIDEERAELLFDANYVVRAGQRRMKAPKSDQDRRLALDGITLDLLRRFKAARNEALAPGRLTLAEDAFVFSPDPLGERPWHPDHWTHTYRVVAGPLGIVEPLKNLRHFNATQLLAAGVDLRTTAGRLGHSDGGATTLRVYATRTRPADQQAADQLANALADLQRQDIHTPLGPAGALRRVSRPLGEVLPEVARPCTYDQIHAALVDAIANELLAPGDLLPTVTAIAQHYGVARSTAQRAVTALAATSLVKRGARWQIAAR